MRGSTMPDSRVVLLLSLRTAQAPPFATCLSSAQCLPQVSSALMEGWQRFGTLVALSIALLSAPPFRAWRGRVPQRAARITRSPGLTVLPELPLGRGDRCRSVVPPGRGRRAGSAHPRLAPKAIGSASPDGAMGVRRCRWRSRVVVTHPGGLRIARGHRLCRVLDTQGASELREVPVSSARYCDWRQLLTVTQRVGRVPAVRGMAGWANSNISQLPLSPSHPELRILMSAESTARDL